MLPIFDCVELKLIVGTTRLFFGLISLTE